jgi:sodium transport system permease protein
MKSRNVITIFKKHIVEMLRDKRTVFVIFILPILLYPIMVVGFAQLSIVLFSKMAGETYKILVQNSSDAPELFDLIETDTQFAITQSILPDSALQWGEIELILKIPEDFESNIAMGASETLHIEYNGAKERSDLALGRLNRIINEYSKGIVAKRIQDAGLDTSIIKPISDETRNVASEKKMGGMLFGRILALIVVLMVLTGAYYPSVDMIAGEKERGTLETLLVSPVGRMEIVVGKYLTVFVLALVNALLNLASMGLTIGVGLKAMAGNEIMSNFAFSIDIGTLLVILLELIPLAALFSAVFMAISAYANSYKEAQGYLTPDVLMGQLPAMAALLPGMEISFGTAFIPVMNVALLFKAMMIGEFDITMILAVWLSTALYAAIALKWASSILSNEEALLSETKTTPFSNLFDKKKARQKSSANGSDAIFLFAVVVALLIFVGAPAQASNVFTGLILTEIAIIAFPPILLAKRFNLDFKEVFRLRKPNFVALFFTGVMAVYGAFLLSQLQLVIYKITGMPIEYFETFVDILSRIQSYGILPAFAVIAVLPAVCEEILFRGYILDGLTRKWGPAVGIILSGVLFGAFHMDPHRLIPATLLGIMFGAIVWRRNSIFYGITGHLVNNSLALAGLFLSKAPIFELQSESFASIPRIIEGVVLFGVSFFVLWSNHFFAEKNDGGMSVTKL